MVTHFLLDKCMLNNHIGSIKFGYITQDCDSDYDEPLCNCNLCYIFKNIILFATKPLICKKS
jgi:hypothetical protein